MKEFISDKRNILILSIIAITVGLDQITKIIARATLPGRAPIRYLNDLLVIQYSENTGAFLSMGADLPSGVRMLIFSGLVSVILAWVAWSMFKEKDSSLHQTIYLALIVGGGVGNVIDRISRGSVTDFLIMGIGNLRTGIFNVADMAVTAAAIIMLVGHFKKKKEVQS